MISIDFHYETFLLLFLVSALVILIKVVFLPIRIVSDQTNFAIWEENTGNSLQLVPFKTIIRSFSIGEWKMQVLGNILLLLPVPIFMKLQNTKNTYSKKKLFLVGLALSFAIEVIQFCINILTGVTGKYVSYSTVTSVEIKKNNVLFNYSSDDNIWTASYGSFENGYAYYDKIKEFVEKGQLDKKYLDMVTLTPDEVKALKVDRNTDAVPDKYFVYDMTEEPGTSSEKHIHSFTSTVVKPTETAQGYTLHTCTKCGYSYKDNYTPALKLTELTGVKVKTQGTNSLTLAWDKNANAKGYIIEQYKGGKWTQIAKTSSNTAVTYTVNRLAADTTYIFRIKAYVISGESEIYGDYVRIAGKTRIANVASFKGSAVSASAVKLDWSKNDKATGYVIEQYKGGKWTAIATTKNNTTLTFTVKGLADDTAYSFRIKSYRTVNGVTDFSEYTSVKAKTLLGNVKTFTATATGTTAIKLDWSKNNKATAYVIEQYRGGKWTVLATTKNNTTLTFTVKGLAEGTAYSFRIKSFRKTGSTTDFSEYTAILCK